MKIGHYGSPVVTTGAGTSKSSKTEKGSSEGQSGAVSSSLQVSVSQQARALSQSGGASFDQARVDRLRESRQSGGLSLDSAKIAQRLEVEN